MIKTSFKKVIACITLASFIALNVGQVCAQGVNIPAPGTMVAVSSSFVSPILKGIKVDPKQPLNFDFILDTGSAPETPALRDEANKLIRYFLASLTIPEKDLWVNLSPYEKDRIIPDEFSKTEMGRDLLAQDYLLKQITASLIYPENETGKAFWAKVYAVAYAKYGVTDVPVDTFNKVWIVADKARIYENGTNAFIVDARLKVMTETDYMAQAQTSEHGDGFSKDIIREVVIPVLEKEVNEGANFALLRQVYYSLILAKWYKEALKGGLMDREYAGQNKTSGVDLAGKDDRQKIYAQYLEAFAKGAFNYVTEEYDVRAQKKVPRKYFSGGCDFSEKLKTEKTSDATEIVATGKVVGINGYYQNRKQRELFIDRVRALDGSTVGEVDDLLFTMTQGYGRETGILDLMELAREGNLVAKQILKKMVFDVLAKVDGPTDMKDEGDGFEAVRKVFLDMLRQHQITVTFSIDEPSAITSTQGFLRSLGIHKDDNVLIAYWGQITKEMAEAAFPGYKVFYAQSVEFSQMQKGVTIDFDDEASFMVENNGLILPYHPFKLAIKKIDDALVAKIRADLEIKDRQVLVLGSISSQDLIKVVDVYKDLYGSVPVDQAPVLVVAPRNSLLKTSVEMLGAIAIGGIMERKVALDPETKDRMPFSSMKGRNVLLLKTQGELMPFYALPDAIGLISPDHNLLEPGSQGSPVFYFSQGGYYNNAKVKAALVGAGGALEFSAQRLKDMVNDAGLRRAIGNNGFATFTGFAPEIAIMTDIAVAGTLLMALFEKADLKKKSVDASQLVEELQRVLPAADDEAADWKSAARVIRKIRKQESEGGSTKMFIFGGYDIPKAVRNNIQRAGIDIQIDFDRRLGKVDLYEALFREHQGVFDKAVEREFRQIFSSTVENAVDQHATNGVTFVIIREGLSYKRMTIFDNGKGARDKKGVRLPDLRDILPRKATFGVGGDRGMGVPTALEDSDISILSHPGEALLLQTLTDEYGRKIVKVLNRLVDPGYDRTGFHADYFIFKQRPDPGRVPGDFYVPKGVELDISSLSGQVTEIIDGWGSGAPRAVHPRDPLGGVDLDPERLELQQEGQAAELSFDGDINNIRIDGLVPVIRAMTPVPDIRSLMSAGR